MKIQAFGITVKSMPNKYLCQSDLVTLAVAAGDSKTESSAYSMLYYHKKSLPENVYHLLTTTKSKDKVKGRVTDSTNCVFLHPAVWLYIASRGFPTVAKAISADYWLNRILYASATSVSDDYMLSTPVSSAFTALCDAIKEEVKSSKSGIDVPKFMTDLRHDAIAMVMSISTTERISILREERNAIGDIISEAVFALSNGASGDELLDVMMSHYNLHHRPFVEAARKVAGKQSSSNKVKFRLK